MRTQTIVAAMVITLSTTAVFLACQKGEKAAISGETLAAYHWPPDTMYVALLGGGKLEFRPRWRNTPASAPPVDFTVAVVPNVQTTVAGPKGPHTPPDTTAAGVIKSIIDQKWTTPPAGGLLLVKWPPDTTGGKHLLQ